MQSNKLSVRDLCQIAIFTAIICICAQISIPMPYGVPLTLQTFAIPLAGVILGPKKGTLAVLVYILIGAIGMPVFSGFKGGLNVVVGATGGFILSFPLMTLAAGIGEMKNSKVSLTLGVVLGILVNYLCGIFYFSFIMMSDLRTAFIACVLPFIPTDIIKIILVIVFGSKLKKALVKSKVLT